MQTINREDPAEMHFGLISCVQDTAKGDKEQYLHNFITAYNKMVHRLNKLQNDYQLQEKYPGADVENFFCYSPKEDGLHFYILKNGMLGDVKEVDLLKIEMLEIMREKLSAFGLIDNFNNG